MRLRATVRFARRDFARLIRLILRASRSDASRRMGGPRSTCVASWFETRLAALLTMRSRERPRVADAQIAAAIFGETNPRCRNATRPNACRVSVAGALRCLALAARQQRRDPARGFALLANGEDRDHDRHADERARDAPEEGPEEHREQHQEWRHSEGGPRDPGFEVAADQKLDQVEAQEHRGQDSNCARAKSVGNTVATSGPM